MQAKKHIMQTPQLSVEDQMSHMKRMFVLQNKDQDEVFFAMGGKFEAEELEQSLNQPPLKNDPEITRALQ